MQAFYASALINSFTKIMLHHPHFLFISVGYARFDNNMIDRDTSLWFVYFRVIRALCLLKWGLVCVLQNDTSFVLVVKVGFGLCTSE